MVIRCPRGRSLWIRTKMTITMMTMWSKGTIQPTRRQRYRPDSWVRRYESIWISVNRYPVRKQDHLLQSLPFERPLNVLALFQSRSFPLLLEIRFWNRVHLLWTIKCALAYEVPVLVPEEEKVEEDSEASMRNLCKDEASRVSLISLYLFGYRKLTLRCPRTKAILYSQQGFTKSRKAIFFIVKSIIIGPRPQGDFIQM